MIEHQGVFLPDGETHLVDWMTRAGELVDGRGTYQIEKLRAAIAFCKTRRAAVDVGAHCGLWSMQLVKEFEFVLAFEPVEAHRECFRRNVTEQNVILYPVALGAENGARISIHTAPTSSGDSWVSGPGDIQMRTLDSMDLSGIDFLKIDCEGYELNVLRGAVATIREWSPVICVEQKPGHGQRFGFAETAAVDFLLGLGYRTRRVMAGDYIMVRP
jgi:FkbM family methyltransferase